MWDRVDRLGVIVLDAGLASMALLMAVVLAMLISRQPARRLQIARCALIGSLCLVPLIGIGLVPRFNGIELLQGWGVFPHPILGAGTEFLENLRFLSERAGPWPFRALTVCYFCGVILGLAWLFIGYLAVFRVKRTSTDPSAETQLLYESLPIPRGVRRPSLQVGWRITRPMLLGTFRSMILIPPEMDQGGVDGRAALKLSLLHEIAHAEGADGWFGLIGNLASSLWFFIPPLWWIRSRSRLDQEFLADRRAALTFGPLREYASSLLGLASSPGKERPGGAHEFEEKGAAGSALFHRILMLLRCPYLIEVCPPVWWKLTVAFLLCLLTYGISSIAIRLPQPSTNASSRKHQFALGKLELPPSLANIHGRVPLFELPLLLPERFDLTIQVWGDLNTLSRMRISGLALDSPIRIEGVDPLVETEMWHTVRLQSNRGVVSLSIDGIPVEPFQTSNPATSPLTQWLSVETAPELPGFFQNLLLTW